MAKTQTPPAQPAMAAPSSLTPSGNSAARVEQELIEKELVTQGERASRETDFYAWCLYEARNLRVQRPVSVDWVGLAEELEDMGQTIKNQLTSHLAGVLEHLLKLEYEPNAAYRVDQEHRWKVDLAIHRDEVNGILEGSGVLTNQIDNFIAKAYPRARRYAGMAMIHLPAWHSILPSQCPWSVEQIRDDNFFPTPLEADGQSR